MPMSPWLLNILLDIVVREAQASIQGGVCLDTCRSCCLLMTVLVAENEEDLKHNIKALQETIRMHKLTINWGKTNTMVISRKPTEYNIEIEEHCVKSVNETVYLGVKISADGRMEGELDTRIGSAMSAFGSLKKNVFGSRELSWKAKVEVCNAVVVPMMTYGCESCVLREKERAKLQATEMNVLRKVAKVTRLHCIGNDEIRQRLQQRSIVEVVKERR